jgi:SAM-dependent methyltransferase
MQQMDATQLEFPSGAFDRVLCGFALFFFPDPHRALQEFFRVLRPGGRVVLTTWAEDCPYLTWLRRELSATMPVDDAPAQGDRFDTPARLESVLERSGFVDIHTRVEEADFVYSRDEEWWLSLWSHGFRQRLERLDAPTLARVKAELMLKVQALKQADGIHNVYQAYCAVGTRPGA